MHFNATILAGFELRLRSVEIEVTGHKKVQVTVQIVIAEGGAGMPPVAPADACPCGHIGKLPVTAVPVQNVRTEVGHQQIDMPIVVVVSRYAAKAPAGS